MAEVHAVIQDVFRRESRAVVATLIRILGSFEAAEDAVQEAFAVALSRWPTDGVPDSPAAWITTVARRRALDRLRRRKTAADKVPALQEEIAVQTWDGQPAERDWLRLIFTCCHPALHPDVQVALTLRVAVGLQTPEIAAAFLLTTPTLSQRILRAKRKIAVAGIPYRVPEGAAMAARLDAVLATLYTIFDQGMYATAGEALTQPMLIRAALQLAEQLVAQMPDAAEARGLLALLLLHTARQEARVDATGVLIPLDEQDRSRWDPVRIRAGLALLRQAIRTPGAGRYVVQAAIAGVHSEARCAEETDWTQIAILYDALFTLQPSPVVQLNHAVAVGYARGPAAGLRCLAAVDEARLRDCAPLYAARADLLARSGDVEQALIAQRRAIALTTNPSMARALQRRMDRWKH